MEALQGAVHGAYIEGGHMEQGKIVGEQVQTPDGSFSLESLRTGMTTELEHCDITCGDPIMTAKIALAHLRENSAYYSLLEKAGL